MTISLTVENIELFLYKSSSRRNNDKENKIREYIIQNICNKSFISVKYYNCKKYGDLWKTLLNEFIIVINKIYNKSFSYFEIVKKGGRNFNYDFEFLYYSFEKKLEHKENIEFKHNCNSIYKTPQILSLQEHKSNLCSVSYGSFYYDYYLEQYLDCDNELKNIEKISKNEYLSLIINISHICNPFFTKLYERKNENIDKKKKIVKKSIQDYLDRYGSTIDLDLLNEKIKSSQDKTYLFWDLKHFHIEKIIDTKILNKKFIGISLNNSILVELNGVKYKLLLRWRNNIGILNTAFQISITK